MQVPNRFRSDEARIGYVNWERKPTRTGVWHIGDLAKRKAVSLELEWTRGSDRKNNGGPDRIDLETQGSDRK